MRLEALGSPFSRSALTLGWEVMGWPRAMPDVFAAKDPAQIIPTTLPLCEASPDRSAMPPFLTSVKRAEGAHLVEGPDQLLDVLVP